MGLTDFNVDCNDYHETEMLENRIITIFNVKIAVYLGKKRLNTKFNTIIKIDWLPQVSYRHFIHDWLNSGSDVNDVQLEMIGYKHLSNVADALDEAESTEIHLYNVQIF